MQGQVFNALRRHLAHAEHVDVSQYQFINLEAVREAAGGLWETIRARVFVAAESLIRKHVAGDDLVIPCASGFLVVFKDTEGAAAQRVTESIAADMKAFFLGEEMTRLIGIETSCEQLSVAEFAATLDAAGPQEDALSGTGRARVRELGARRQIEELVFHPAWDPQHEAVACFSALARRRRPGGRSWESGAALLAGRNAPKSRLPFDLAMLALTAHALEDLVSTGARCGVIMPAGYSVLANPGTRTRYVGALAALPQSVRKLIFLKLEAAPLDAPAGQVLETCRTLEPYCGRLLLHAPLQATSLVRFEGAGANLIGASLPGRAHDALDQDLERFCALARRIALPVYFDNVAEWDVLKVASRTPARLLAGPAFGTVDTLQAPYRLTRARALVAAA